MNYILLKTYQIIDVKKLLKKAKKHPELLTEDECMICHCLVKKEFDRKGWDRRVIALFGSLEDLLKLCPEARLQ